MKNVQRNITNDNALYFKTFVEKQYLGNIPQQDSNAYIVFYDNQNFLSLDDLYRLGYSNQLIKRAISLGKGRIARIPNPYMDVPHCTIESLFKAHKYPFNVNNENLIEYGKATLVA